MARETGNKPKTAITAKRSIINWVEILSEESEGLVVWLLSLFSGLFPIFRSLDPSKTRPFCNATP